MVINMDTKWEEVPYKGTILLFQCYNKRCLYSYKGSILLFQYYNKRCLYSQHKSVDELHYHRKIIDISNVEPGHP